MIDNCRFHLASFRGRAFLVVYVMSPEASQSSTLSSALSSVKYLWIYSYVLSD